MRRRRRVGGRTGAPRWRVVIGSFLLALAAIGCGSPEPSDTTGTTTAPPAPCAPGELTLEDGSCQPAGLPPDMPCPPGELALEDGSCQKAGVPPSQCGQGFVPDGEDGCEPVLPAGPCPEGTMAVPGDTECHEVAPCGSGTWGDIPVEASTEFVDQAYAGGDSDGSKAKPWTTIQAGIDYAKSGAIVAVAAGTYDEDVFIHSRPVRLWGRCPAMVEIAGIGQSVAALAVVHGVTSGTEVHGIAFTGPQAGIGVSGSKDVLLDQVRVHGTGHIGVDVQNDLGPTSAVLRRSLVEQSHAVGVYVLGSAATLEATAVRSIQLDAQQQFGRGIDIEDDATAKVRANVTVRACLVEQSHDIGVFVGGSDATIEATVVRSTQHAPQAAHGGGIAIQDDPGTKERANATVRACLVEQNDRIGVYVKGSDATIEATVVRSSQPAAQGDFGRGIGIEDGTSPDQRANVTVRACLVEQNHEMGVLVGGSDATIEATVVRGTLPDAQGDFGRGIDIVNHRVTNERANVTVRACLVEQNRETGVRIAGSDGVVEGTVVRSTRPNEHSQVGIGIGLVDDPETKERGSATVRTCLVEQNEGVGVVVAGADARMEASVVRSTQPGVGDLAGVGVAIQEDFDTGERASATVRACLVEQSHNTGVWAIRSDATLEATVVRDTASTTTDQQYGDGIFVWDARLTLQDVEVTANARAGLAGFGGEVTIDAGVFTCNAFDINGEISPDSSTQASFGDHPDWQCSKRKPAACTELGPCKVEQSDIAPPPALPPLDPSAP